MTCNICHCPEYDVLYTGAEGKDYGYYSSGHFGRIVTCKNCGLKYIHPRDEKIEDIYENIKDEKYLKSEEARIDNARKDIAEIERYQQKGSILDIGCGPGLFLKVAREKGWRGQGIELSKWAFEYGKKQGLSMINKNLEDASLESGSFDVVTMWDVIEHVEDPSRLLKEAHRIMKKSGLLVLNTPDIGSLFAKLTGKRWWNLMRMHIYYFDRKTIRKILEKSGFEIIKVKSYARVITPKHAVEWLKNYGILYHFLSFLFKKTFLGDARIKVNFGDNMVVFAGIPAR